MTKGELNERIARLEGAAGTLGYTQRAELRALKVELEGRRLDDVTAALAGIERADLERMDAEIDAATAAIASREQALAAFERACRLIRVAAGIAI